MINETQNTNLNTERVIIKQVVQKSNGIGTAGFVLALLGLILGWIPFLGWLLWILGLIFSFVGIFNSPKGLAIAGLIISFIGIILIMTVFGAIFGASRF